LEARELRRDPRGELRELAGVLWWPTGEINGRYLTPWLEALDENTIADHLPRSGGMAVQTDLHREVTAS
jgi:hypothetical protein